MSSEPNQFFDVANLRMPDRFLTKAGFQGEQIYAVADKEISATSLLAQCFQRGVVDEATLKSALRMYLATTNPIERPLLEGDGSLARWLDDGDAPVRIHTHTRLWLQAEPARHGDPVAVAFLAGRKPGAGRRVAKYAGGRWTPWKTITGSSTISECIAKCATERSKLKRTDLPN